MKLLISFALFAMTSVMTVALTARKGPITIPLPLGSITLNKKEDGQLDVSIDNGLNIAGYGAKRNTTLSFGNGTMIVDDNAAAIVDGKESGGGTTFGFANNTVVADGNVKIKNQTAKGGLGKPGSFLTDLINIIKGEKKN